MKKIFVGNMDRSVSEQALQALFEAYGTVQQVNIVVDDTGRPKGFGFVEMTDDAAAQKAIATMNGQELSGKVLTVSEAHAKTAGRGARR